MEMQLQSDHNLKSLASPTFYVTSPTASRTPSGITHRTGCTNLLPTAFSRPTEMNKDHKLQNFTRIVQSVLHKIYVC
jgi:hypothetical protein